MSNATKVRSTMRERAAGQMRRMVTELAPLLEASDYPTRWADYIGQEPAKQMLLVAAKSAKIRKQSLPHILISHPSPGIGKTALAALAARAMGTECRVVSGQLGVHQARLLLSQMSDGDVLFYDEFHQLFASGKKHGEWMLHYLQDGVIMGPAGAEPQPKVTVIGATTDAGKVPDSIVGRFLMPPMQEYSTDEAAKIAMLMGKTILEGLPRLNKNEATALARAAANNPRAIRRLLTSLRDVTITNTIRLVKDRYNIPALLELQGITADGLDRTAQTYLIALAVEFQGSAGAKALEERLQQPGGLGSVERVLMDMGLVAKTRSGRVLTQDGIMRARDLVG